MAIALTTITAPIKAEAGTNNHVVNIVDMILTKTGIVADHEILTAIESEFRANMRQLIVEYDAWLTENGIEEITIDTFNEYVYSVDTEATTQLKSERLLGLVDENAVLKYIIEYRTDNQINIDPVEITTGKPVTTGKNVTISDDLVKYIRQLFDEYSASEGDYFYVKTVAPSEINPLWFETVEEYNRTVALLETLPYLGIIENTDKNLKGRFSFGNDNTMVFSSFSVRLYEQEVYFLSAGANATGYNYAVSKTYDSKWNTPTKVHWYNGIPDSKHVTYQSIVSDTNWCGHGNSELSPRQSLEGEYTNKSIYIGLVSNDGREVKIYNTLEALKADSIGRSPYYITSNFRDYYDQDNSIKVSGDYVLGDYTTSHDTIQEQINNSGTINNETINNIVNDSSQTIINNYASTVLPETDDDNEGDNDNGGGLGSILDGLGSIIGGVADLVGFLLGVIGEVIGLIGDLFNTIFNGIKAIGEIFAGFTGLLGSMFPFIPQELVTFLTLAVEASVGVAIWRQFKKG